MMKSTNIHAAYGDVQCVRAVLQEPSKVQPGLTEDFERISCVKVNDDATLHDAAWEGNTNIVRPWVQSMCSKYCMM